MKFNFLFAVVVLLLFSNCTVQKRLHRPGWHVEWNKKYRSDHSSSLVSKRLYASIQQVDSLETLEEIADVRELPESIVQNRGSRNSIHAVDDEVELTAGIIRPRRKNSEAQKMLWQNGNYAIILNERIQEKKQVEKRVDRSGDAFVAFMLVVIIGMLLIFLGLLNLLGVTLYPPIWLGTMILILIGSIVLSVLFFALTRKKHHKSTFQRHESAIKREGNSDNQIDIENPDSERAPLTKKKPTE